MVSSKNYNLEIQAVRAIAIGMVLFSHIGMLFPWWGAQAPVFAKGFYIGVDLFLCLSGYVIAKGISEDLFKAQGDEFWRTTASFWVRRVYRILPSAWLWLFIPLIAHTIVSGWSRDNARSVVAALAHVGNIDSYLCAWVNNNCGWPFIHYWSLSLEEQFYLLLPFLFLTFRRRLHYFLIFIVIIQVIAPRPLGVFWGAIKTDALMLGVLLALWSKSASYRIFEPNIGRLRYIISPLLLVCLIGFPRYEPVPFYIGMAAIISAIIVWLCSYQREYFISEGPLRKILVWVGERSFAMYLIHPFAFWLTNYAFGQIYPNVAFNTSHFVYFAVCGFGLLFLLCEINYRFIESPLRRKGASVSQRVLTRQFIGDQNSTAEESRPARSAVEAARS